MAKYNFRGKSLKKKQKFGDWTQRNNFFDPITENNLYGKMVDRGEVELTGIDQVTFNLPVIRRI